jgi:hypothetical protein
MADTPDGRHIRLGEHRGKASTADPGTGDGTMPPRAAARAGAVPLRALVAGTSDDQATDAVPHQHELGDPHRPSLDQCLEQLVEGGPGLGDVPPSVVASEDWGEPRLGFQERAVALADVARKGSNPLGDTQRPCTRMATRPVGRRKARRKAARRTGTRRPCLTTPIVDARPCAYSPSPTEASRMARAAASAAPCDRAARRGGVLPRAPRPRPTRAPGADDPGRRAVTRPGS